LSPDAVSGLISDPVIFSINGNNAYRGQSVLAEKRGQPVASDIVTVRDNATIPSDYNSSSFDREGSPHQNLAIVEKGVFKRFLYDSFAANRESSESTGNATGTFREIPRIGTTNFMVERGSHSLGTLIAETEKGLLISRFSGTSQQVSGDFSGAVRGAQVIKSGEIQYPVKEATIAGNVFDILPRISDISKETLRYSQTVLPYIKVSDMEFTA
jgi:PmbA protein